MGHGHARDGGHAAGRSADRRRMRLALTVTATVLVVEVIGALLTGSLALLADAAHMATDATAVLLALGASYLAARPANPRVTFGWHRAEVLAALANALVLLGVCAYLGWQGVARLLEPAEVEAGLMIAFAAAGLVANGVSLAVLSRSATGSINVRAATMEVFADTLGSLLAVVAGIVILASGWTGADAVASLVIAGLILPRAVSLLRECSSVLLEAAPRGLDLEQIEQRLLEVPGVVGVHDLHAWTITTGLPSLSAHVTVTDEQLAERGVGGVLDRLCATTDEQFGVKHATFQVEPQTHLDHEDLGETH